MKLGEKKFKFLKVYKKNYKIFQKLSFKMIKNSPVLETQNNLDNQTRHQSEK